MTSDFLTWIRETSGFTQQQLAQMIGISVSYVRKLEDGDRRINHSLEQRIVKALSLDDSRLIKCRELYVELRKSS